MSRFTEKPSQTDWVNYNRAGWIIDTIIHRCQVRHVLRAALNRASRHDLDKITWALTSKEFHGREDDLLELWKTGEGYSNHVSPKLSKSVCAPTQHHSRNVQDLEGVIEMLADWGACSATRQGMDGSVALGALHSIESIPLHWKTISDIPVSCTDVLSAVHELQSFDDDLFSRTEEWETLVEWITSMLEVYSILDEAGDVGLRIRWPHPMDSALFNGSLRSWYWVPRFDEDEFDIQAAKDLELTYLQEKALRRLEQVIAMTYDSYVNQKEAEGDLSSLNMTYIEGMCSQIWLWAVQYVYSTY